MRTKMLVFTASFILFCFSMGYSLFAMPKEQTDVVLNLRDCFFLAMKNNVDIAIQRQNPLIDEWEITNQRSIFDPVFSFDMNYTDSITPFRSIIRLSTGISSAQSEDLRFLSSLSGLLPTGMRYGVEFESLRSTGTTTFFNHEYESLLGFSITQPILRNFGMDANLYQIRIAKINKNISDEELRTTLIDILTEAQHKYWDLLFAIKDYDVRKESLELAQSLLDDNRKRVEVGILPPIEITQAESGVAAREELVIIGRQNISDRENDLKVLLYNNPHDIIRNNIVPQDVPLSETINATFDDSFAQALKYRPEYLIAQKSLISQRVKTKFLFNQLLPELNIVGRYNLRGIESGFPNTLDTIGSEDNREWIVGFELEIPLGNRASRSQHYKSKLEERKRELDLRRIELKLVREVDNAVENLKTNYKRVSVTVVSKRLAEEALEAEIKKLEQGSSTSHNVLEFQTELSLAKFREIRALIDLRKSIIDLYKVEGTLLNKLAIKIE